MNTLSIIIPTKNRPNQLQKLCESISVQTKKIDQVIIIDQSENNNVFKDIIKNILDNTTVVYIHDKSISGLVHAKQESLKYNTSDIITFLDDDIVLTENYFQEILRVFQSNTKMMGCNGRILNAPLKSYFSNLIFNIFHIGIFSDNRSNAYRDHTNQIIELNTLSGGLSSWRKEVFYLVKFDVVNGFHAFEDKEFSIRVNQYFSGSLAAVMSAKLYHYHAKINRESLINKTSKDIVEVFKIFKKNKSFFAAISLNLFLLGLFFQAIKNALYHTNFLFIPMYFKGVYLGLLSKIKVV